MKVAFGVAGSRSHRPTVGQTLVSGKAWWWWGRGVEVGGCTEVAVRHMRPENWSSLHHGHKQGHDSRDPSTVWTCDHGQATSPLWASLCLLGYKMGNHSGLSRSCTLRSQ